MERSVLCRRRTALPLSCVPGALQCGLTSPAGTGKTVIGVALARALLAQPVSRVLLLAQTNHALDQFAEAIIESGYAEDSVLRIGGRTKSPLIERLSMHKLQEALIAPGRGGRGGRGGERMRLDIGERERTHSLGAAADRGRSRLAEQWERQKFASINMKLDKPQEIPLAEVEEHIVVCHDSGLPLRHTHALPA